ncbi:uncharacterized protein F4822DRAFT_438116 [Hypoxylon trugodes]|uniref:uncharacterized protein n=1 Tax=Hypoxylon trugodes TaxID=326681 RepID=UPI00219BFDA4|nr:uncharacterized protein F4822DRAFT_438116 [Hypoxylon trugodes]KAI1385203.1 hypothetical protein F4822DRAFT_438116 [Hypoxylon trugodes]
MSSLPTTEYCPEAQCLIAAGLQSHVLVPSNAEYTQRIESYWCNSAKLRPACIVQPSSASEVATAVKALADAGQVFAVRSGGHGNWAGSNNIDGGVTIDLGLISSAEYDATTELAHIGPAGKWKHVYEELEKHGRVVAGAREAEVGVGGFLLGGGNTFYSGRVGFGCDNVVAYEVVLADGRIITADATGEYSDLFRVLKGGGNNFGIVTKFTMRTFSSGPLWGGYAAHPMEIMPAAAQAFVDFTANSSKDPDSTLNLSVCHMPHLGGSLAVAVCTNVAGVENPPAFRELREKPEILNNLKKTTLQEVLPYTSLPPNFYNTWYTLTFKNDASIIAKAHALYTQLTSKVQEKVAGGEFTTHCSFQPIPKYYTEHSVAAGGNIFGLERYAHDAILIQASVSVRTPELASWARPQVREMIEGIRKFAESVEDGICPWLYINYASPDQNVLQSYGKDNVDKMRNAAAKYDPKGVFQRLCPGGFKISAVKD